MSKYPHVTMGNNVLCCLHCGTEYALQLPMSINMLTATGDAFTKDHRYCKPSDKGAARMQYKNPAEWRRSWDTGLSSLTIYDYMTTGYAGRPSVPLDSADFGRCVRLLDVAPGWRQRMQGLAELPGWRPLVQNWDMLEKLFREKDYEGLNNSLRSLVDPEGVLR